MKIYFTTLVFALIFINSTSNAQILFDGGGSTMGVSSWLSTTNWTGDAVPTGSQIAQFGTNPVLFPASFPNASVSIVMTNLPGQNQSMAAIQITSARTAALTISNSSSMKGGTMTLNGTTIGAYTDAVIDNQGSGVLTIAPHFTSTNATLFMSIVLPAIATFTGSATGTTRLTCGVAGATTSLTNASGRLKLERSGGTTLPATTNVNVTGGTLQISTNQTLNNLTLNGGSVVVDDGVTLTVNGVLTFTSGTIALGTTGSGNVVAADVSGGNSASFVITNGTGGLTVSHASAAAKTYAIGSGSTSYDPVTITSPTACSFKATVAAAINPSYSLSATQVGVVTPRQWDITLLSGAPTVTLALTSSNTATAPTGATGVIGHWNGVNWDVLPSTYAAGTWTATNVSTFSPFIVSQSGVSLGVALQNLDIKTKDNSNVLNWSTASEKNNAYFDVQHAINGLDFQTIGTVKGNGTTNAVSHYTYEHKDPSVGTHYYRLRQVDTDGKATLSKVVSIQFGGQKSDLKVFPTVAFDKLNVLNGEEKASYSIFNLFGQNVQMGQLNGQNTLIISNLSAGTYVLKVGSSSVKFFKN